MQTFKQPTANQQGAITLLPQQKKVTNQALMPSPQPISQPTQRTQHTTDKLGLEPTMHTMGQSIPATSGNMKPVMHTTTSAGGLLGNANKSSAAQAMPQPTATAQPTTTATQQQSSGMTGTITQPVKPNSPEFTYSASQYNPTGYTGVQGNTEYNHDPRSESLVQNQITGLLDPNSPMMRKAIAQAQGYSAARGLQSSSTGSEVALSSMIDKALPIAQQDAQTYGNADQLGWQQGFQADQANLGRTHDASMLDAQGSQRMQELNAQQGFQAQMADLQYKQQLGVLDYQGQQQLQQMDRNAQLTKERDQLMQSFDMSKLDKTFLMDLEKTKAQWERDDFTFAQNVDANTRLQYQNASAESYNRYLEQVAAIYNNPEMTPDQQDLGVARLKQMFEAKVSALEAIYGFAAPVQPGGGGGGGDDDNSGIKPEDTNVIQYPDNPNPGGGGGGGGGGRMQQK
ncbi:hypothetical protein [Rheinheimera sp. MMS21-TC3]|uniref:hypothetical protein n=1 Tax=Rheinheimera sp. MMS21-TC3 TaxID=3072790 RepID=UPI0028C3C016|nr:hypothetical protein [Rheinheimera sp. MMS21-TC3]WNO60450.1 hypothetical protein RDV63_05650 [Rheinheimera sp. MMS21-TC3]